jgi:hypothetical protein
MADLSEQIERRGNGLTAFFTSADIFAKISNPKTDKGRQKINLW